MGHRESGYSFDRRITSINNRPQIYIVPSCGKDEPPEEPASVQMARAAGDSQKEATERSVPL